MLVVFASIVVVGLASVQQCSGHQSPCLKTTDYGKTEADKENCTRYYSCTPDGWKVLTCRNGTYFSSPNGCSKDTKCASAPQLKFGGGGDPVLYYLEQSNEGRALRTDSHTVYTRRTDSGVYDVLNSLPQELFSPEERRLLASELAGTATGPNQQHTRVYEHTYTEPQQPTHFNIPSFTIKLDTPPPPYSNQFKPEPQPSSYYNSQPQPSIQEPSFSPPPSGFHHSHSQPSIAQQEPSLSPPPSRFHHSQPQPSSIYYSQQQPAPRPARPYHPSNTHQQESSLPSNSKPSQHQSRRPVQVYSTTQQPQSTTKRYTKLEPVISLGNGAQLTRVTTTLKPPRVTGSYPRVTTQSPRVSTRSYSSALRPVVAEEDYSRLPTNCGRRVDKNNVDRIFGGVAVDIEVFPWQVGLKNAVTGEHFCGGTIISKKFVLTAAHCFLILSKPQHVTVRVGDTSLLVRESTERDYKVDRFYVHEMYKPTENKRNDIALIKVEGVIEFNEAVQPACLPHFGLDIVANENCAISGWGATETSAEGSKVMMATAVPLVPRNECVKYYKPYNITIAQFCAGKEGYDTCKGDSGGPLVCRRGKLFSVHGITSFGIGCGLKNRPGVYTMVSMYRLWIESKMGLSSTDYRTRQEALDYVEEDLTENSAALQTLKELVEYEDTDINET